LIGRLCEALWLALRLVAGWSGHASCRLAGATRDTIHELIAILHVDVDLEVLAVSPLASARLVLFAALRSLRLEFLNSA
jgi:type 1 glutamine amidotransferase